MRKKLSKIILLGFSAIFLTSGIYSENLDIKNIWSRLNANYSLDLNKQSFCLEVNGSIISQNQNEKVRPASVTKLYTSFWALNKLGYNYRFKTQFLIDKNKLFIIGGNDAYFVSENIILILNQLNQLGIEQVSEVVFDKNFFINWENKPTNIRLQIEKLFNTNNWSSNTTKAFYALNDYLFSTNNSQILKPIFKTSKVTYKEKISLKNPQEEITHLSSPLYMQLKPINMYSNNFYTDSIFDFLGGQKAFSDFMYTYFSATEDDIKFYTGSGLGENYTTCELTLRLLAELEEYSLLNDIPLEKFISVAGLDEGTLKKRFTENNYQDRIIAKTGTLRHTSALAGYINNSTKTRFALFNHTYNISGSRDIQNKFIKTLMDKYLESERLDYEKLKYPAVRDIIIQ